MAYRDQMLECSVCGTPFVFGVHEQRRMMEEQGEIVPPATCPRHRQGEAATGPAERRADRLPQAAVHEEAAVDQEPSATQEPALGQPPGEGRFHGRVKWFDPRKGYGFLVGDDGREVFVHYSALEGEGFRTLYEGQEVEFDVESTPRGPQAVNVVKLSLTPQESSE